MSGRHHSADFVPAPRADLRAHAHNERHRVHSELHLAEEAMRHGTDALDVIDPADEWKPGHNHGDRRRRDRGHAKAVKHWKQKMWKRRSAERKRRAQAWSRLA